MIETRTHRRVHRNRKKRRIPLSKLHTSEVVRTVVAHPRRLEELINMLDDRDRSLRDRAAKTLARLSESHPGRLIRVVERVREALVDDSAYVRWHLVYTLGRIGSHFPLGASRFLQDLSARLDDENRIVRILASRALNTLAVKKPRMVEQVFESTKRVVPASLARILRDAGPRSKSS